MSEPKLISPMLDNFRMGEPITDHYGVRSCPAMDDLTGNKYIVKIISSPASAAQLDALLLTGAYSDKAQALEYYNELANGIMDEVSVLKKLSELEGFIPFENQQLVPMDDENGYDVYLLSPYRKTLAKHYTREPMTHLQALNLGLDLCAALTVSRNYGYLFVNLKPENIYITTDNRFRIGDLGFIKMDALKFASLSDRYRSNYTAPEISDAYATLNPTIDVYAVGMILYQAFNGGQLPVVSEGATLPAPDYADYEMAEIILKACSYDPNMRWTAPAEMGRALVEYMQRNGVHNTPIVPPVIETPDQEPAEEDMAKSVENDEVRVTTPADATEDAGPDMVEEITSVDDSEAVPELSETDESVPVKDETQPGEDDEDIDPYELSSEVSEILNQADELLSHPAPAPVVAPEATPVEVLEEAAVAEANAAETSTEVATEGPNETDETTNAEDPSSNEESNSEQEVQEPAPTNADSTPEKKKSHWLRNTILILSLVAVLVAGFLFVKYYYIQTIDDLVCTGIGNSLTVTLTTDVDEKLLTVVCTDTYGNKFNSSVINGVAEFHDLQPNSPYTVKVKISGFHTLTGKTSTPYVTPKQTTITDFKAFTGNEDGSVVLHFAIDGPDAEQWVIQYTNDSGESCNVECTDRMATIQGLTIGNEYVFTLTPVEEILYTGTTEIKYIATKPVVALDLHASNITANGFSVSWAAPSFANIEEWTVLCTNENGYEESLVVTDMTASFENMTDVGKYTVEVTAVGMLTSQRITVDTGANQIKNIQVSDEGTHTLLTWECDVHSGSDWYVEYTIDSTVTKTAHGSVECSIVLPAMIPGSRYMFVIGTADATFVGNVLVYSVPAAENLDNFGITNDDISLRMCYTPSYEEWNIYYLLDEDFTTTFRVGDSGSFAVSINTSYERSRETVSMQVAIHDDLGNVVDVSTKEASWRSLWSYGEGSLDLPALPDVPGQYTATVYINGEFAGEQVFIINN